MKKLLVVLVLGVITILAGCGSVTEEDLVLGEKHAPLDDYILSTPTKVQETYVLAANYPQVLASVPCYCGCNGDGHVSNLDCFIGEMGSDNNVMKWDPHGTG